MIKRNKIYHMSALDFLAALPDQSVDLQVFDPPYGIGYKSSYMESNGKQDRAASCSFGDDTLDTTWIPGAFRVLRDGGACYLFTRWDVLHHWHAALEGAGYHVRQCIVWDKAHWGAGDLNYYGSQTEFILFATKGKHKLRWSKREGNLWRLTKMDAINNEGNYDNPTQKPENLIARAIVRSSDPGDVVLDCFVGSGTTAAAARRLGRDYYACDVSRYQYMIACDRLALPARIPMF